MAKTLKNNIKNIEVTESKETKAIFKTVENGNLWELHKTENGITQKVLVTGNKKEFDELSKKYKK